MARGRRGGYHFWQGRKRWAAHTAYQIRVSTFVPPPDEPHGITTSHQAVRLYAKPRAAQSAYHTGVSPQIADEVYGVRLTHQAIRLYAKPRAAEQAYTIALPTAPPLLEPAPLEVAKTAMPDRALRKRVAASAYSITHSPEQHTIPEEVTHILFPDRARRKHAAPTAYGIRVLPPLPVDELPEELSRQLFPSRARRKRAASSAYETKSRFVIGDQVPLGIRREISRRLHRKVPAADIYTVTLAPQTPEIADLPPGIQLLARHLPRKRPAGTVYLVAVHPADFTETPTAQTKVIVFVL